MALCKACGLSFEEVKEQVAIGLFSEKLSDFVLTMNHLDEDDLFQDLINYERVHNSRRGRSANELRVGGKAEDRNTRLRQREASGPNTSSTEVRCYNCNTIGHFRNQCPNPPRLRGSCYVCGSQDHQRRTCPQVKSEPEPAASTQESNSSTMLVEDSLILPKAYRIPVTFPTLGVNSKAIIDTGSPISMIREDIVPLMHMSESTCLGENLRGINNTRLDIKGLIETEFFINNQVCISKFYVVTKGTMSDECLLGRDFICNPCIQEITFCNQEVNIRYHREHSDFLTNEVLLIDVFDSPDVKLDISPSLPFPVVTETKDIISSSYYNALKPDKPEKDFKMHLTLKSEQPFFTRPRRLFFEERNALNLIINDLLEKGIIRESSSSYCSSIVLTKKKTGEYRLCIDYRTLNKTLIRDQFPLPLIDDHLDNLKNKCFFTKLDLRNAFYHVSLDEQSMKYTSFITPSALYEFCKMPFGLSSSPSTFSRFLNEIFKDLIRDRKILLYLDDILIATVTVEENLQILKVVLDRLTKNLLELRLDKCSFLMEQINFLGYHIDKHGITLNDENVEAIKNYPLPSNAKQVQRFLGLASYFRRFVQNFSLIAKPLYDLLRKNAKFEFNEGHVESFETLKNKLISKPILAIYSVNNETELHCDASSLGFGSILFQKQVDGKFHPVFYYSKRTTDVESKYHSYELETLAVVNSLKRFHVYLQGIPFKIVTDCDSFRLTLNKREIVPRIMRWCLFLQNYDYTIEHRSNTRMHHVDALSRIHNVLVLDGNTLGQTLALKQLTDDSIHKIKETLENKEHPLYELRNGLVYRKTKGHVKFYVPEKMEYSIIYTYHNDMGHGGLEKVLELISRTYWFPGMKMKIRNHIDNCLKCIEFNPKSGRPEGFLHSIPQGNLPFECVHIDHYGPLQQTGYKNKYVFEVIDAFSKFVRLFPCKTTNANEVITHLRTYFQSYSCPKMITSDRGACFTSQVFADFMNENDVRHTLIASGAPRANGQIERINRMLTPILAKTIDTDQISWDRALSKVEFCINNTINRSTKETPAKLVFGRNQIGQVNDSLRLILESLEDESIDFEKVRDKAARNIVKN